MTPVVTELNRLFPETQIDVLVKKGNESLLANHPAINSISVFDKSSGKWRSMFRLIKQFREQRYDLVINLHRFASSGIITWLSGGKQKLGFKKNPFSFTYSRSFPHSIGDGTHEVERNLMLINQFGAESLVRPTLYPSQSDHATIQPYLKDDYFCLAPASVWFTKQLPVEKWIELIHHLGSDKQFYLLGAPADHELCESICSQFTSPTITNLAGKLSLLQSAALMKSATRNYVNDSGPLHIASSVNAPVTAFFCSTIPAFGFGPLSDDSKILEVQEQLACRPCGLHGHKSCPEGHFNCGKIDVRH